MGLALPLGAQDPTIPPLPTGPLLKRTPDYSTWSVTVQKSKPGGEKSPKADAGDGKNDPEKPAAVTQSRVVKTGATILELNVDVWGKKEEIWHLSGLRAMKPPDSSSPIIAPDSGGGSDIYSTNFTVSDFAGLDWISAGTYTGMAKYQGRDCLEFKSYVSPLNARAREEELIAIDQAKAFGESPARELRVPAAAYIDLETRLPLLVTFGEEKRIYQYGAPPQAPLALPPELAGPVKAYVQRIKRLSAPAAKAF
jgi:hypothetical protein